MTPIRQLFQGVRDNLSCCSKRPFIFDINIDPRVTKFVLNRNFEKGYIVYLQIFILTVPVKNGPIIKPLFGATWILSLPSGSRTDPPVDNPQGADFAVLSPELGPGPVYPTLVQCRRQRCPKGSTTLPSRVDMIQFAGGNTPDESHPGTFHERLWFNYLYHFSCLIDHNFYLDLHCGSGFQPQCLR